MNADLNAGTELNKWVSMDGKISIFLFVSKTPKRFVRHGILIHPFRKIKSLDRNLPGQSLIGGDDVRILILLYGLGLSAEILKDIGLASKHAFADTVFHGLFIAVLIGGSQGR